MEATQSTPTGTQRAECPFDRRRSAKLDRIIITLESCVAPLQAHILRFRKRILERHVPPFEPARPPQRPPAPAHDENKRLPWPDTAGEEVRR